MPNIVQIQGSPITKASSGFFTANLSADFDALRGRLINQAQEKLQEAIEFRDAILLKKEIKVPSGAVVLKGTNLHPIIIGYVPDPPSFEWYLDEPKQSKEDWKCPAIYAVPSKHKFLDSNILPGVGFIVPMEMTLRPIDLMDHRFFFSWYGGFVVAESSNNAPKSK